MRTLSAIALALVGLGAQGYSPAPRDIAPIDMKSSCAEEAAVDVNRGAAFLMALAPIDARRAFARALVRDPDCALAGWGRAMSWLPNDPWRISPQAFSEGRDAVQRAAGRGTPREQAYVKTVAALFGDSSAGASSNVISGATMSGQSSQSSHAAQSGQSKTPPPPPPAGALGPVGRRIGLYHDATRNLAAEFPDDPVTSIVYARAALLRSTVPADDYAREAASIIERRFGVDFTRIPDPSDSIQPGVQLGAALTLLLARDGPTLADVAQGAAIGVSRMATLPLARHLPTRSFVRIGEWAAAAESTEAAIKLAGSPASPELVYGIDRRDVAAEWLVEAYLQQGRFAKADALIAEFRRALDAGVGADDPAVREVMFDALVRMHVRSVLARADWTRGLEANVVAQGCDAPSPASRAASPSVLSQLLPDSVSPSSAALPINVPTTAAACAFMQAYSAARLAWPGAKADRLQEAARVNERLGGVNGGPPSIAELLRVTVRAAIAAGQEEHQELELLLMHASDLEERLLRSGQLVLPFAPVAEIAGDLFYQANRFEQARRRYSSALNARPYRARSMLGFARASVRLDSPKPATDMYRQLLSHVWKDADPDLPEIAEARAWIENH